MMIISYYLMRKFIEKNYKPKYFINNRILDNIKSQYIIFRKGV